MPLRTITICLLTLALAGSSVVGIQLLAKGNARTPPTSQVAIAKVALERGVAVRPEMIELKPWPQDLILDGMLTSVDELSDRVVLSPVVAGEPLLDDKLALPGVGPTIASRIPVGMRAITIPTPTVSSGVAGFVLPGNRVDVLLTLGSSGARNSNEVLTVTVAQNVEILAVNQKTQMPRENHVDLKEMQSVTLLTTLQQASRLQLGQSRGSLHLILRNPADQKVPEPYHACLAELQGEKRESAENTEAPKPPTAAKEPEPIAEKPQPPAIARFVRTMRGTQTGRVSFEPYFVTTPDVTPANIEMPTTE